MQLYSVFLSEGAAYYLLIFIKFCAELIKFSSLNTEGINIKEVCLKKRGKNV